MLAEAFLPKVDGVTKTAYLTLRYLQETGREVLIFAPDNAVPAVGETRVIRIPSVAMPFAPETSIALLHPTIARDMAAFQPDMVLMFSPVIMSVSGMASARHLGIPVIANYQTDGPGYAHHYGMPYMAGIVRRWMRYVHNGCHLTLTPAEQIRDDLHEKGFKRLRMWKRGINLERFNPEHYSPAMRERLLNGRDPDSLLCIYAGRLAPEKCVNLLHEVAQLPGVALTIIGDGASREELEQQFADTDTYFTGYLFGEDLSEAFASADAFFFPGAQETFGQVVQEAMAAGLPVVVTRSGAVSDLVREGITGFVCDHDSSAFKQAAIRLRDDPYLARQMGTAAHREVQQRPWSAIMTQLEQYMQEAVVLNERFKDIYGTTSYHQPLTFPLRFQRGR